MRGAMFVQRLSVLILAITVLGLPINDNIRFFLLALTFFCICVGTVRDWGRPWLGALVVAVLSAAIQLALAPPRIEEGHNIFLPPPQGEVIARALPAEVHAVMVQRFLERYPESARCKSGACWTISTVPRPFGFSADAVFQQPRYSRVVGDIDFAGITSLRGRFVNELAFSWYDSESEVKRSDMPFFVVYQWPEGGLPGSRLCFTGEVMWEVDSGRFELLGGAAPTCRDLSSADGGRRVFGLGMSPLPLSMQLEMSAGAQAAEWARALARVLGIAALLGLLVRLRPSVGIGRAVLVLTALAVVAVVDPTLMGGLRALESGNDGIGHAGQGGRILQNLLAGEILPALQGGEAIFYFMPGLRYMRALEGVLFGDSNFLYLLCVLAVPVLVFRIARHLLPLRWVVPLMALFLLTPLLHKYGGAYWVWVRQTSFGMPDPMGYTFFLTALVLALPTAKLPQGKLGAFTAFMIALLLALASWLRPNLLAGSGVMLAALSLHQLVVARSWRAIVALAAGFSLILLMPLHNWYFGGRLVLFTSSIDIDANLITGPKIWLAALSDLASFKVNEPFWRVLRQLREWSWGFEPLHMLVFFAVVNVACRRATPFALRLVALPAMAQQFVLWVFDPRGFDMRYMWLAWLLSLLIALTVLRERALPALTRRFPALQTRLATAPVLSHALRVWQSPRWKQLTARLDRWQMRGKWGLPNAR